MQPASKPTQRRAAFRQAVAIVPSVAHILYGGVARRKVKLGVIDLSATGISLRSRDELRAGDLLALEFVLEEPVSIQARVRRVTRYDRVWDAGCAFEGINERQAEHIVKYVFAQQRVSLRARRGDR